jgi:hypothetical protein
LTDEQYKALLNEVIAGREAANSCRREVTHMRGELLRLEGAVTSLRGDVIILGAGQDVIIADIDKLGAKVDAMIQTIDGINHLAKSSYDMASSNVQELRTVRDSLGLKASDGQSRQSEGSAG